jgi:hypothetical protein
MLTYSYSYFRGVIMEFKHLNQPDFDRERDGATSKIIDTMFHDKWWAFPPPSVADFARRVYNEGYKQALRDWSIWKDGVQHIGCMQRSIKEIIEEVDT